MRLQWLREGVVLVAVLALSGFCFFDEEPLFDASDWNATHCLLLLFSCMGVIWENVTRARYGQFVYKDQVLLFATFSFWFFIENYLRALVVIFCAHSLVPLEAELIELVEVYQTLMTWVHASMLPSLLMLTVTLGAAHLVNLSLNWGRVLLHTALVGFICLLLLCNIFFCGWDLLFASMGGVVTQNNPQAFYAAPKTSLTYDQFVGVQDQFDWHRDHAHPFVMRFEDLYMFFLQLFNLLTLTFALVVWLGLLLDLLTLGQQGVSFTYVSVGLRWLDQALWNCAVGHLSLFFVGTRIALRTPFEFWSLIA